MLTFGENPGEKDTPTRMALAQCLNDLRIKNGFYYRVPHEKIYFHFVFLLIFRREEAPLYLTASVGPLVGPSVGRSVRWSVPILLRKLVTSQLFLEEEEENWLRRYSFVPRD
jgi:hypothetical protein